MTTPGYIIGKDEMLLIAARWRDGDTVLLEMPVRLYKAEEIQALIDETTSQNCTVISVDLYDVTAKKGMSIADDFDIRPFAEREEDRKEGDARDEMAEQRRLRHGTGLYNTLNHTQQGIQSRA